MSQAVFVQPEMSWRRKMSANTSNRIQIQTIQRKKIAIARIRSRNG